MPGEALLRIAGSTLRAGGAEVAVNGDMRASGERLSTRLDGRIGPMPIDTLKTLWPRALGPGARSWVGAHMSRAAVRSGAFQYLSGAYLGAAEAATTPAAFADARGGRHRDVAHSRHVAAGRRG